MSRAVVYSRIDLHAACIHHGTQTRLRPILHVDNSRLVILHGHLRKGVERTHRHQRNTQSIAHALGERHPDTQARIGAGAHTHGYGIQLVGRHIGLAQQFIHEDRHLLGVVASLVALAQRYQLAVAGQTDRTYIGTRLNAQYQ